MSAQLRPLVDEELASWIAAQRVEYIADRVRSGETPDEALATANRQFAQVLPDGRPAPGHLLSRVLDGDEAVGWLWIGPRNPEHPESFWVWDVVIDAGYRGRGLGRAAMLLAEEQARAAGAMEIGLNVFGHNKVARSLYESMGYDTMAVQMLKPLTSPETV